MSKSKSTISWGVLFIIIGILILFIFALTQRVSFEKQEPLISVEGFVFNGSTIVEYNGDKEIVEIPSSYSFGDTENYSGIITFNDRAEAFQFLQEHYTTGANGYYDFYEMIYNQLYPWTYEYSIDKPTFIEGRDVKITSISNSVFQNNKKIKQVILPKTIKTIELFAFRDCSNLEIIDFSEGLKRIGDSAFWGINIKSLILPNTVEQIDPYAFFNCKNLEEVELSSSLKKMTLGTFNGCDNLKQVTFLSKNEVSANYTTSYQPFSRCPNLESIYVYQELLDYYLNTEPWNLYAGKYRLI